MSGQTVDDEWTIDRQEPLFFLKKVDRREGRYGKWLTVFMDLRAQVDSLRKRK